MHFIRLYDCTPDSIRKQRRSVTRKTDAAAAAAVVVVASHVKLNLRNGRLPTAREKHGNEMKKCVIFPTLLRYEWGAARSLKKSLN